MSTDNEPGKGNAAAAWFAGFLTLALGGAGLIIAALAVGAERAWTGGATERGRAKERGNSWLDTQAAWLDNNHRQRVARQKTRQDWLASGADPDHAPPARSRTSRLGEWLHRRVAKTTLGARNFGTGFADGWRAADHARASGAGFQDLVRARPQHTWSCPGCGIGMSAPQSMLPTAETEWCPTCRATRNQVEPDQPNESATTADQDDVPRRDQPLATADDLDDLIVHDDPTEPAAPSGSDQPANAGPNPPATTDHPAPEGAPMAQPADTNATVLAAKLDKIREVVAGMTDDVDALHTFTGTLAPKARNVADLSTNTGMPTETVHAADTLRQAVTVAGTHLDDFAAATEAASEQLTAAVAGLDAVHAAVDRLHQVGADSRAFDTTSA